MRYMTGGELRQSIMSEEHGSGRGYTIKVRGYTRRDGKRIRPHYRERPKGKEYERLLKKHGDWDYKHPQW